MLLNSFQQKQYHQYSDFILNVCFFCVFFLSLLLPILCRTSPGHSHTLNCLILWDIVQRAPFLFAAYASKNKLSFKFLYRLASVLKTIFINVSYHILVASLTQMALF